MRETIAMTLDTQFVREQIIQAAARDKKKQGQHLFFVFLETLGRARVEKIGYDRLNDFIRSAFK